MSPDEREIQRALREAVVRECEALEEEHPSPEDLIAYQERSLPEARANEIRGHLTLCTECADFILDLEDFPNLEPVAGDSGLTEAEHAEGLTEILTALPREETPNAKPSSLRLWPLAAALAIGLGAGLMVPRVLEEFSAPGPIPEETAGPGILLDLYPDSRGIRDSGDPLPRKFVGDEPRILILNTEDAEPSQSYRLEIHRDGEVLDVQDGLWPDETRVLAVILSALEMPPGAYELHLLNDGASEPRATYRIELLAAPEDAR